MTIITEYRWKCELCGAVSPTTDAGPIRFYNGDGTAEFKIPLGWQMIDILTPNEKYPEYAYPVEHHFCCENHREQWEAAHK